MEERYGAFPEDKSANDEEDVKSSTSKDSKSEDDKPWSTLIYDFTQDTTFHGVRYITAETPYVTRRVIWTVIVLLATSFFFWFMSVRLQFLQSDPKTVDVEVIYTDTIDFPAVTICNQNLFRTSATHQLGLHDVVEESWKELQNGVSSPVNGMYPDTAAEGFESYRDHHLVGMGRPHAIYVDVTSQVCRHVCVKLHSDSCCSVVYVRATRTCYVTPMDQEASGAHIEYKPYVDYFQRRRCQVQTSAKCSFSSNLCTFVQDRTKTLSWQVYQWDQKTEGVYPQFDHTNMSASGSYLLASAKFHQPDSVAHLVSPFILAASDTCMQFYYQVRHGTLNIKTRPHGQTPHTLWSESCTDNQLEPGKTTYEWERGYVRLPAGYYRVVIEGTSPGKASAPLNIAVDDVDIGKCEEDKLCKESALGKGYSGLLSMSRSRRPCQSWKEVPTFLQPEIWRDQRLDVVQENMDAYGNYCRNPDDDPRGPWCFVNTASGESEYCSVPLCECRENEFTCGNGRCISPDLLCNKVDDCGDLSDELAICNSSASAQCDFEETHLCGYESDMDQSKLRWRHGVDGDTGVIHVHMSKSRAGDRARLLSPDLILDSQACISLDHWVSHNSILDLYMQPLNSTTIDPDDPGALCRLGGLQEAWNTSYVYLPSGSYRLVFEAIVGSSDATVKLDNITLLNENCTFDVVIEEIEVEVTTELNITDIYTNVTEFSTEGETTFSLSTVSLTTENVITTTEEPMTTTEIIPEVKYFCNAMTDCPSCSVPLSTSGDCHTEFKLIYVPEDGFTSRCPHIATIRRETVEECLQLALGIGANVVNIKKKRCYAKRCKDHTNLKLVTKYGGWSIYSLYEPDEKPGLECSFRDNCGCGYRYESSNIYDVWIQEPTHIWHSGNDSTNETQVVDHYMTVNNTAGQRQRSGDWTRLISPVVTIEEEQCLMFRYFTRYTNIRVFSFTHDDKDKLLDILHDGQQMAWHTGLLDLQPGVYGIIFELNFVELFSADLAGIDNVTVVPERCIDTVVESENSTFECTFDEEDVCGYRDVSEGPYKWIRSKQHEDVSPGGYYLRVSNHLRGKSASRVISPYQTVDNTSCLQFYYFIHQSKRDVLGTLALSYRQSPDEAAHTIWRLRNVGDYAWHFAQTQVPEGRYQILFEFVGSYVRGGIDDVTLLPGECPTVNCSVAEKACTSDFTCISEAYVCDGIPNCYLAEDEICGETNITETEETVTHGPTEATYEEHVTATTMDTSDDPQHNLTEIYMRAAHQGEDLIYRCKFEGSPCSSENFTKQVTDYGTCYTFNNQADILRTAKTGSRFGLSLTINIEQYEYMRGPQSDAGVKVFLHTTEELPQVRDLGFAVPPGTHALIGVRLNEAINLPAPHGDCDTRPQKYYNGYIHSRCLRECETRDVVSVCHCRDAYMPGYSIDDPPICNLSKYFSCAIPEINSVAVKECDCPKPCQQTLYEPSLSSASLSVLSVDNILSDDTEELLSKFHDAVEATQRINVDIFEKDLIMLADVDRLYDDMLRFAKNYLGDFEQSSLAKVSIAASTLVNTIFLDDLDELLGDMDSYVIAFKMRYGDILELIDIYFADTKTCLKEIEQLIASSISQNQTNEFLLILQTNCMMRTELMRGTLTSFMNMISDDSTRDLRGVDQHMPVRLTSQNVGCHSTMQGLSESLSDINVILQSLGSVQENERRTYSSDLLEDFKGNNTMYLQQIPFVELCLDEYPKVLGSLDHWLVDVRETAEELGTESLFTSRTDPNKMYIKEDSILTGRYNYTEESAALEADKDDVEILLRRYSLGRISKLEYLEHFRPDDQNSEVLSHIDSFVERIKSRLTDPLRQRIQKINKELERAYSIAMQKAANLEQYLTPQTFYAKSERMKMWRVPEANLEDPHRYTDQDREHWKVWDREVSISEFAETQARSAVSRGLDSYTKPLLQLLDNFEEQLMLNKQKLVMAMDRIQAAYEAYIESRVIDHKFVLSNFMNMDVYFAQLKHQSVRQIKAYDITQFLGDVGGFMGLLLGGSALTVCELMDLIVFNFIKKLVAKRSLLLRPSAEPKDSNKQKDKEKAIEADTSKPAKSPTNFWVMDDTPMNKI